jgi:DNA polymerase III subunit epsilon
MILCFDTETSDLVLKNSPANHPNQPHIVQLAALLAEDDGTEVASFCLTVKPTGWTISDGAISSHGITLERAASGGVPLLVPLACFSNLAKLATTHIGHNVEYDIKVITAEFIRAKREMPPIDAKCTMRGSEAHVNLPPTPKMVRAGFNKPKAPTLTELYSHLFGETFDGAHNALVDSRACLRCYLELRNRGVMT